LGIYKNRESWFRNGISKLPRLSGLISLTIQLLQLLMNQKIYTSSSPFLNKPIFAFFCMIGIFFWVGGVSAQQPSITIDSSGDDIILEFESDPKNYYILKFGTSPVDTEDPIALTLGDGLSYSEVCVRLLRPRI